MKPTEQVAALREKESKLHAEMLATKRAQEQLLAAFREEQFRIAQELLDNTLAQLTEMGFVVEILHNHGKVRIEGVKAKVVPSFKQFCKDASKAVSAWPQWEKEAALEALGGNLALSCEHANEMPAICRCPPDCYCKSHSCKNRKAAHIQMIVTDQGNGGSFCSNCGEQIDSYLDQVRKARLECKLHKVDLQCPKCNAVLGPDPTA